MQGFPAAPTCWGWPGLHPGAPATAHLPGAMQVYYAMNTPAKHPADGGRQAVFRLRGRLHTASCRREAPVGIRVSRSSQDAGDEPPLNLAHNDQTAEEARDGGAGPLAWLGARQAWCRMPHRCVCFLHASHSAPGSPNATAPDSAACWHAEALASWLLLLQNT